VEKYLSQDRRRALRAGRALPDTAEGTALFADIAGFTALTSELTNALGPRRGIEVLAERVNEVYESLIDAVEGCGGNVVGFAGDAITCWFDENDGRAAARAVAAAHALQARMSAFGDLELKVAVCSGRTRRFVVGDPTIQLLDTLAGATCANLAVAERLARPGDVVVDQATLAAVGEDRFEIAAPDTSTAPMFVRLHAPAWRLQSSRGVAAAPVPIASRPPSTGVDADLEPWLLAAVAEREHAGGDFLTELRPLPCSSGSVASTTTVTCMRRRGSTCSLVPCRPSSASMRALSCS
jgi:adenylate cyclase